MQNRESCIIDSEYNIFDMDVGQIKRKWLQVILLDKLGHTFDMDVKISAKKKSGNVIACTKDIRKSLKFALIKMPPQQLQSGKPKPQQSI